MNKKLNFIFKNKKIYKVFLYLLVFFVIIFSTYFFIPKFFNYAPKLIEESLVINSDIKIKNISNINYKFLPSPRLSLSGTSLEFKENILAVEGAEIEIILNPLSIINYKILDYNKILIKGGFSIVEIDEVDLLFNYIKQNKKKIIFKKNKIVLLKNKKKLFEVSDSQVKINTTNNLQQLNINGFFFNHKITFILKDESEGKTKIVFKIPELDISSNITIDNKDKLQPHRGLVNIEVLNNFFQFNFSKEQNIKIKEGFLRSGLINSLIAGNLSFKPYFSFDLNIQPSTLNIEKLILILQKKYFLEDLRKTEFINKIDGSLNFRNMFRGSVVFKNTKIFFQNFKVGKVNPIFFDANISQFGPKGKVQFNLNTSIQYKKKVARNLKMSGYVTPSTSKVTFSKIIFDEENFTEKKINNYEEKFKNEVIDGSLSNIFNEKKIKNFFKNFKL
tara:strand:- start:213 stop:1550 length:1338 start_codon:yes stop_codon:yes gene_type:complete